MIKWIGSPNFDTNRTNIDRIIIHWIVGNLASADAVFAKAGGVSAHYAVEDGTIHQYVKEENVAYHAGVYSMNQRSIGIEHSASPDRPASDQTYDTSGKLIAEIAKRYNIPLDREHILKHSEVKATQCCGTVDIDRLITIAKQQSGEMVTITQKELDTIRNDRDKNWNLYQEEVSKNAELTKQIQDLQQQLQNLRDAFDKQTQADADTGRQLLDVSHERDNLKINLETIAEALHTTTDLKTILEAIQSLQMPHEEVVKNVQPLLDQLFAAASYKRLAKKTSSVLDKILFWIR